MKKKNIIKAAIKAANLAARKSGQVARMAAKEAKIAAAIKAANRVARKSGQIGQDVAALATREAVKSAFKAANAAKEASHAAFKAANHAANLADDFGQRALIGLIIGRSTGKGKFGRHCGRWDPYYN